MPKNDLAPIRQVHRGAVSPSHDHLNINLNLMGTETLHPNICVGTMEPLHPSGIPRTSLHTARTSQEDQPPDTLTFLYDPSTLTHPTAPYIRYP